MNSKKIKIKNIRNILESPFQMTWTEKNEEEILLLQNALKDLLPVAKLERKPLQVQFKKNKVVKLENNISPKLKELNIYRTYLAPGFHSVIRGLENKELCCVVLCNNVMPVMIQKVVLAYTQINNVPTVVMPGLKAITKSTLGFATMVLGFKNVVAESSENQFHSVYTLVSQNPTVIEAPVFKKLDECEDDAADNYLNDPSSSSPKQPSSQVPTKNLYLYRKTFNERVFVPRNKTKYANEINITTMKTEEEDYMLFEKTPKSLKKPIAPIKPVIDHISDDDDDDNSDEDVGFFVDNKADITLLNSEGMQTDMNGTNKSKKFKTKSILSTFKSTSNEIDKNIKHNNGLNRNKVRNKQLNKKKHKNTTKTPDQQSTINYKPLHVKMITGNKKKVKRKKKQSKFSNLN